MTIPSVDLSYCELSICEPGIVYIFFKTDTDIDEAVGIEILSNIISLTKGEPHALVYDMNKKNIIIREITRKISGVRDARTSNLICRAFIAGSLQNRLESKHYIQNGKPSAETKYFTEKNEALEWIRAKIKEFRRNNKA